MCLCVAETPRGFEINTLQFEPLACSGYVTPCYKSEFVTELILPILAVIRVFFRSRSDTALEVLALRQQVAVLKRKRPRPKLNSLDRLFWTTLHRFWPRWSDVLVIVKPETVIGWHRAGFRLYWRWRSRPRGRRPRITGEMRDLIRRMAEENAGWGAPKIHGELKSSVSRSRNEPWLGICAGYGAEVIRDNAGWPFCRTTVRSEIWKPSASC